MKKLAFAAVLLALAAAHAAAQGLTPMQIIEQGEREERARVDRQYEASRRVHDRPAADAGKVDPWASVRPAETAAKPRTKKPRAP